MTEAYRSYEHPAFRHFCEHVNARLTVMECHQVLTKLADPSYDRSAPAQLVFPIGKPEVAKFLASTDYDELLQAVGRAVRITAASQDSFRTEFDAECMEFFERELRTQCDAIEVAFDAAKSGYVVSIGEMASDLVLPIYSQLHTEIFVNADGFLAYLDAVGGDPSRLFLNAKAASAYSNYIQAWVAARLDIPLQSNSEGMVAVV